MLPDLNGFLRLGKEFKNDQECEKWRKEEVVENKVSKKYTSVMKYVTIFVVFKSKYV